MKGKQEHLNDTAVECLQTLTQLKIPIGNVVEFKVNTRSKARWGQCRKRPDGYYININEALCDGKHDPGLKSTLLHELLHTCEGCMNHGYARAVSNRTGVIIRTTDSAANKGFSKADNPLIGRQIKYKLICKQCGHVNEYKIKTKAVKQYMFYRCGICQGDLTLVEISQPEGKR